MRVARRLQRWLSPLRTAALTRLTRALREKERRLTEQALLLQTTLDHVGQGIQMIDAELRIVVANRQAVEMLGVPPELMAQRPHLSQVFAFQQQTGEVADLPPEVLAQFRADVTATRNHTYRRRRPDGRMLEVQSRPLPGGGMVRIHTDITERDAAEQRAHFLATRDVLTGLANRRLFLERLESALASGMDLAVLLVDLDRFKDVNDTLGHPTGDALLRAVAERLQRAAGHRDVVARLGGDEFAMLLLGERGSGAPAVAAEVIRTVGQPCDIEGSRVITGASVGLAYADARAGACGATLPAVDDIMKRADLALYEAKGAGRGAWQAFRPEMAERLTARRTLESDLREALVSQSFELHYQPLIDLGSGAVSGFEALLRWRHPTRGLLAPGSFIPAAEANGLITQIGAWVLRRAVADAAAWPDHLRVAINLSPVQFRGGELVATISEALASPGLAFSRLELEITETTLMQQSEAIMAALTALRARGARIALDDFGTGYSSLSYIRKFPFDTIKIDQSFVAGLGQRRDCEAILRAVTGLARDLDMRTLAEGVETAGQLAQLRLHGCDEAQGLLFSPPRPVGDIGLMIAGIEQRGCVPLPTVMSV